MAFVNQIKAVRGFAVASGPSNKPVTVKEVAAIVEMHEDTVSMIAPFFLDVGLLQGIQQKNESRRYVPSPDVASFSKAHEWNAETAPHKLGPILSKTWFYEALSPKLAFAPISEDEAIGILGERASAGPPYRKELGLLIDYLAISGLVARDNGQLRLVRGQPSDSTSTPESRLDGEATAKDPPTSPRSAVITSFAQPTMGIVNFHIDVKVDMAEFADWPADRINAFFGGIAQILAAKGRLEKEASS